MSLPRPRLIACDLDGTLLDSQKLMSPRLTSLLEHLMAQGIFFVPATGRSLYSVPDNVRTLTGLTYLITSYGVACDCLFPAKRLFTESLPTALLKELYAAFAVRPTVITEVFIDGRAYLAEENYNHIAELYPDPVIQTYVRTTRTPVPDLGAFLKAHPDGIENMNFVFLEPKERQQALDELKQDDHLTVTSSSQRNLEITNSAATKGHALGRLCQTLNIDPNEVWTFGDSPNDADLLTFTPYSFAMENAHPAVASLANHQAPSCNADGVYQILSQLEISH